VSPKTNLCQFTFYLIHHDLSFFIKNVYTILKPYWKNNPWIYIVAPLLPCWNCVPRLSCPDSALIRPFRNLLQKAESFGPYIMFLLYTDKFTLSKNLPFHKLYVASRIPSDNLPLIFIIAGHQTYGTFQNPIISHGKRNKICLPSRLKFFFSKIKLPFSS